MSAPKSLSLIINRIKKRSIPVKISRFIIKIGCPGKLSAFLKIKQLLYLLINKFENSYFIAIEGLPYCLMPDASNHMTNFKKNKATNSDNRKCLNCKFVEDCPGWPKNPGTDNNLSPSPARNLPEEIVLEITQKCNQDCRICFSRNKTNELSINKIEKIINSCCELGIKTVRFTGGEPLFYKDIATALNYAKEKKLYVILNTNATVFNEKIKKTLTNRVDNILISLQGFNKLSEYNLTKSKVDFEKKIMNIIEFNRLIPTVRVGTIISKTLLNNFFHYYYLLRRIGIKNWEIYRPMTNNNDGEFKLSKNDLLIAMNYIKEIKKSGVNLKIANPVPFCLTSDYELSSHVLLGAESDDGHRRMIFDAGGFFKPSYFINKNLGRDIESAWNNPFLKKIRSLSFLPKQCRECFYLKWCKGGSRYWAKIANQDYFSPDPLMYK